MKKIIASISVLCYFVVTCGVVFNYHYCMKRLASTHLFGTKSKVCGRCGMDTHESNGCCHDEVKVVKLQQDQNRIPVISYDIPAPDAVVIFPSDFIVASFYNAGEQRHFHNHSPPILSGQDTYLRNNVFRI